MTHSIYEQLALCFIIIITTNEFESKNILLVTC